MRAGAHHVFPRALNNPMGYSTLIAGESHGLESHGPEDHGLGPPPGSPRVDRIPIAWYNYM